MMLASWICTAWYENRMARCLVWCAFQWYALQGEKKCFNLRKTSKNISGSCTCLGSTGWRRRRYGWGDHHDWVIVYLCLWECVFPCACTRGGDYWVQVLGGGFQGW